MYRDIKHMSAEEMAVLLENVFNEGIKSAISNTKSVPIKELHDEIAKIKGIGESRMVEIDKAINAVFSRDGE